MRAVIGVCCAAALVLAIGTGARADEWNKKTFFTFSGPVQIPGATLPAGTYTFKLADLSGNRHVVQVFDKDEKKIYATLMAIPDQRLEPPDNPLVVFSERPAGTPVAVKAWFYPGESIGNEFIYPKHQAMAIAKATHESVLASKTESDKIEKSTEVGRVNESGEMSDNNSGSNRSANTTTVAADKNTAPAATAPARPTTTAPSSVATSGQTSTAPSTTARTAAPASTAPRRHLPRTGSDLPLAALLSMLSLAAGFGVSRARRRMSNA